MGLQYASYTWISRTIPARIRRMDGAYDAGHQMGLQYASCTWISRTIPARIRRMELTMQDIRWVCSMPVIPG
jgi:hypothetical protein